ncbi:MAG: glycoside hydrolase family 15 protein [Firmicutes bacterium]|nr:glycoside hydrolase family 15 protein [Candidatus Fermentithermobacillaceae bacterium]
MLGNGKLFLGFDPEARTREMFWPVVGLTNHVRESADNACLIWYDGTFHRIGGEAWHTQGRYGRGMRFDWSFRHKTLPLSVDMSDCVDPYNPLWVRTVTLNCRNTGRLGLYFKQNFSLGENQVGECGFFHADSGRLYHYKGPYWVAITAILEGAPGGRRVQCTTGAAVAKVRDGGVRLFPETGGISGQSMDHGLIDSIYQVTCEGYGGTTLNALKVTFFLAFGATEDEAGLTLGKGLQLGFEGVYRRSSRYWDSRLGGDMQGSFYATSVKLVAAHCDRGGGIVASCDTDIMGGFKDHYRYVWPRDAAMCASSLIKAGLPEYARRYLAFCAQIVSPKGFSWQRYRPDGTRGSGWHSPNLPPGELPIQEDQLALSLLTALDYLDRTGDLDFIHEIYLPFVKKAAGFIREYRTQEGRLVRPSFDLWEERRGISCFTQAVSAAALMASARIAWVLQEPDCTGFCEAACELLEGLYSDLSDDRSGFFRGMGLAPCLHDRTEDASLFMVPVFLARIEELCHKMPGSAAVRRVRQLLKLLRPRSVITWKRLEQALLVQTGPEPNGIARYTGDWYCRPEGAQHLPGNPWFVTTAWYLSSGYLLKQLGKHDILAWLAWFRANASGSGVLAEQINGLTGEPLSVAPLAWSHSAYVDLVALMQAESVPDAKPRLPRIRRKRRNSAVQGEYRPKRTCFQEF